MLQGKLADVGANFKEVLEVRTKNIQASRSRTENFVSSVSSKSQSALDSQRTDSPLYNTSGRRTPQPGGQSDLLTLEPSNPSPLGQPNIQSDQQLLVMEEAQSSNSYIQARGEAIDAIERTIGELGGIFGQLAQMVSEQSEMINTIDANTEDVVDNVQGAQRELMKYWTRVSSNRWLIAKMFGVLMVSSSCSFLSSILPAHANEPDFLPSLGVDIWITMPLYYYYICFLFLLFFFFLPIPFFLLPSPVWICRFRTPAYIYTLLISMAHTFISCFLPVMFFYIFLFFSFHPFPCSGAPYILGRFLRTLLVLYLDQIHPGAQTKFNGGSGILGSTRIVVLHLRFNAHLSIRLSPEYVVLPLATTSPVLPNFQHSNEPCSCIPACLHVVASLPRPSTHLP